MHMSKENFTYTIVHGCIMVELQNLKVHHDHPSQSTIAVNAFNHDHPTSPCTVCIHCSQLPLNYSHVCRPVAHA